MRLPLLACAALVLGVALYPMIGTARVPAPKSQGSVGLSLVKLAGQPAPSNGTMAIGLTKLPAAPAK
jgi:hypothetical protein